MPTKSRRNSGGGFLFHFSSRACFVMPPFSIFPETLVVFGSHCSAFIRRSATVVGIRQSLRWERSTGYWHHELILSVETSLDAIRTSACATLRNFRGCSNPGDSWWPLGV